MARNVGKIFEDDFKNSIDESIIYYERIKDPATSFGGNNSNIRFSSKNPYDNYAYKYPYFFALELKSTKNKSLSYSLDDNKSMIKKCQIEGLTRASEYDGVIAGIIFNFRTQEKTFFLNIEDFNKFVNDTNKKSININDIIDYGGILIPQYKKRVRYRYETDKLFNMEL